MELVLSNLKNNFESKQKVLFAGEWCLPYGSEASLEGVKYEVSPHPWQNRDLLYKDLQQLEKVYEKYLDVLTDQLNSLHGKSYSSRYWRIVVGPWLQDFIELVFDYYLVAQTIEAQSDVTSTPIYPFAQDAMVPQDITAFEYAYSTPEYIHFLLAQVVQQTTSIPCNLIQHEPCPRVSFCSTTEVDGLKAGVKRLIKYVTSFIYSLPIIPAKFKRIAFVASYFSNKDLFGLQKSLGLLRFPFLFDPQPNKKSINNKQRDRLKLTTGMTGFEKLLDYLIPIQIPVSYIENYHSYEKLARWFFPKKPQVIFTSNSYYFNEAFKLWSALSVERGTKLLISQHGGFGTSKWLQTEKHQLLIADLFYTWGWTRDNEKVKPMPSTKLNSTKNKITTNFHGPVTCVASSDIMNHLHTQVPQPLYQDFKKYISNLISIHGLLSDQVSENFNYRLYHTNYNRHTWNVRHEFERAGVGHRLDIISGFYQSASHSRLSIVTYHPNATSLETLSANHPTLLFFDEYYFEVNAEAKPFFDEFQKVGIYHSSVQSLVQHIEDIYEDVAQWWFSEEVQQARKAFCNNFAYTSDNCIEEWMRELQSQNN